MKRTLLASFICAAFAPDAFAQATNSAATEPDPKQGDATVLPAVRARAAAENEPTGKDSVRSRTTGIAKGKQDIRDVPQSISVVTEKLIDDRNLDTLKDTLKNTGGISFQAAEGGEEDIRLRGFSLQTSGDIFIDGMRDPAFYERDSFNWDRLEVMRGSASMVFGRGSTGGAVNQVSKQPLLMTQHEVSVTGGSDGYLRATGDFNVKTGDDAAFRVNGMFTLADNGGAKIDKRGIAPTLRWGIGTRHEFGVGAYDLQNDNGIDYGLPWLTPGPKRGGDYLWPTTPGQPHYRWYGAASDYNHTGTTQATGYYLLRLADDAESKTQVRVGDYRRDQRASAIRFAPAAAQPGGVAVTSDTFSGATALNRGTNNKLMELDNVVVQSDYAGRHGWFGRKHQVAAGVDATKEDFENFNLIVPQGTTIVKPPTTVGTPNDGASVNEEARVRTLGRSFQSKALGVYAQDLLEITPKWKLLGGLRWDTFRGDFQAQLAQGAATTGNPPVANPCFVPSGTTYARRDSLWSKRMGVLFQPSEQQSYHLSYGTSFNTSGDTYQYDPGTSQTPPEGSRNIELGAKLELAQGRLSTRFALFHSTKTNERNRDAESVNGCNYILSGKRHAAGLEVDIAGRITQAWEVYASYTFIPEAQVDASSGAAGTEIVGSRPGLTPRHSGTFWTTYKASPSWRFGGGLNARGADVPVGLAAGSAIAAPKFITGDLMAEFTQRDLSLKALLTNVADKHYADYLYRGHYVGGKPRALAASATYRFY
jgi:catecholate siderophore receptor